MTDFRHETRISARSVIAGCLVTFATMILLETLAAGFGLWHFNFAAAIHGGFWFWSGVAWIISSVFGAYCSSIASRSVTRADGFVHGITVWAGSTFVGVVALATFAGSLFGYMSGNSPIGIAWITFVANLLACAGSIASGVAGAQTEAKIETRQGEVTELRRAS